MELLQQTTEERLNVYNAIIRGCTHHYSKGQPQHEQIINTLQTFYSLTQKDPIFLAHLLTWSINQESKDLKRTALYVNALSSGDGTPFTVGGSLRKPNLRLVSHALLSSFDPKELARIAAFRRLRWNDGKSESVHFPKSLQRAMVNYLNTASAHETAQHVKHGFTRHLVSCYKWLQAAPTDEKAVALKWSQKHGVNIEKEKFVNPFEGLTDEEIAKYILENKMSFQAALSYLQKDPSPEILASLFEIASPNQLIVRVKTFEESGLLSIDEFAEKFYAKISEGTAADRIERLSEKAAEPVKEKLQKSRTKARQKQFGLLDGTLHLDIDVSISMDAAIETAKQYSATICDCVGANNFTWGTVGEQGRIIETKPESKEAAMSALFGRTASDGRSGLTMNYRAIQGGNAPVDHYMIITDGKQNYDLQPLDNLPKPQSFTIIHVNAEHDHNGDPFVFERFLKSNGITPNYLPVEALKESALVAQSIKTAIKGASIVVEEIMNTSLPIKIEGLS